MALVSSPVCGKVFWPPTEPGVVCTRAAGAAAGVEPAFVGPVWLFCLSLALELAALPSVEPALLLLAELTALELFETVSLF